MKRPRWNFRTSLRAQAGLLLAALLCSASTACSRHSGAATVTDRDIPSLAMMSLGDNSNAEFETAVLRSFGQGNKYRLQYFPAFETVNRRFEVYRDLLKKQSPKPDLYEIDIIWPSLLSDGLIDLRPYFAADLPSFPQEVLDIYTVQGRLLAIPIFIDSGLLYYRSDLLRKYHFTHPPQTWDELEHMASVIQAGERRAGDKDFWGYVWQGNATEALTCNALEWFSSQGGGHILEPDHTIRVASPQAVRALQRAVSWIGTISPLGVTSYDEDDSLNVWKSGHAAFMRNWIYAYGSLRQPSSPVAHLFEVATIPAGISGSRRAMGGAGLAVSRFSKNRDLAIAAVKQLTSLSTQRARVYQVGTVPLRSALFREPGIMEATPFHGALAGQVMGGISLRPTILAGTSYREVSHAFESAIHSALMHQQTPEAALRNLQTELVHITGFRSQ